jgi:hypothetical protein
VRIFPLAAVALGYALLYYALNVLVDAYFRTSAPMNPAPMTTLLGISQIAGGLTGSDGSDPSLQGTGKPTPNQPAMKAGGE